jgi:hypothetical protein
MIKRLIGGAAGSALIALALPLTALAASPTVVTPTNTQGWSTADTRPGGAVEFVSDATAPAGSGALELTSDATTTAKAQYLHETTTPLSQVNELSYYTKQVSALFPGGAPSYQLAVNLTGSGGFTTLVYEPYQNGVVVPGTWQQWDVDAGQFWSSRSVTCSGGAVVAGGGGAPFYTLAQLQQMCPEAVVGAFGVNIGSNNPAYTVETDLVSFNGQAYNFEPALAPDSKEACKNGGWQSFNSPSFSNQGQCVSYVASAGHSQR